jgi:LPS-assembly protein
MASLRPNSARGGESAKPSKLHGEASYALMDCEVAARRGRCMLALGGMVCRAVILLLPGFLLMPGFVLAGAPQQARVPARRGLVQLEAKQQRKVGNIFYGDGDVDIHYLAIRLRADHAQYNAETGEARATGHVRFDTETQSLEGDDARYNLRTGQGTFQHVQGTVRAVRLSNRNVLVSQNPFIFYAREVRRLDEKTYEIRAAWVTVCPPDKPIWKFYTPRATIYIEKSARLRNASFRLFGVPILYLPVASVPLGKRLRQSGFLTPEVGNSTNKGFILGEAFYWAPVSWFDATLNPQLFSRRGPAFTADARAKPSDNFSASYHFFGVDDRGLPGSGGVRVPRGGHESHFTLDALLPEGWRAVADVNTLTSLTFRLAFASTYAQAIDAEVKSTAFLTNNFHGFSLNFAGNSYKNYFSISPEMSAVLRAAPEVRLNSVDIAPWRWPVYLGIDTYVDGASRKDRLITTGALVQRTEIAPRVTIPLHWGPWLGVTTTFLGRLTRYGAQEVAGNVVNQSLLRNTAELTVDLRPASLAKIFEAKSSRWKHVIEPDVVYRYVTGVNQFGNILRFDEKDTLTDTNEVEYSLTQRLYRRTDAGTDEVVSWRVAQKYYFDPTFGGALVPGQRNVFQAVDSLSPFAFADTFRRFSPVVSDLNVSPGSRYELDLHTDYDTTKSQLLALGTLVKFKPTDEIALAVAYFVTHGSNTLQPRSNQVRLQVGYGEVNRKGANLVTGLSYDFLQNSIESQYVVASYNGSCCGLAFEYRRIALGTVRSENQFRVALLIANIGTVGNIRQQEKIF